MRALRSEARETLGKSRFSLSLILRKAILANSTPLPITLHLSSLQYYDYLEAFSGLLFSFAFTMYDPGFSQGISLEIRACILRSFGPSLFFLMKNQQYSRCHLSISELLSVQARLWLSCPDSYWARFTFIQYTSFLSLLRL